MAAKKVSRQTVRQGRKRSQEEESKNRRMRLINIAVGVAAFVIIVIAALVIVRTIGTPAEDLPADESTLQTEEGDTLSEQQREKMLGDDRPLADISPAERFDYYSAYPEMIIDTSKDYEAIISMEKGDIRLKLFDDDAPRTVNSFAFLDAF